MSTPATAPFDTRSLWNGHRRFDSLTKESRAFCVLPTVWPEWGGQERARAANHYDMEGHGAKAEEHLRAAEHELSLAVGAAREH